MTYDASKGSPAEGSPADGFAPCSDREADILRNLNKENLIKYIKLRNEGKTVSEAFDTVDKRKLNKKRLTTEEAD